MIKVIVFKLYDSNDNIIFERESNTDCYSNCLESQAVVFKQMLTNYFNNKDRFAQIKKSESDNICTIVTYYKYEESVKHYEDIEFYCDTNVVNDTTIKDCILLNAKVYDFNNRKFI